MAFRGRGRAGLLQGVRERFWETVNSGLSPTAAATVADVCGATGRQWAREAGYQTNPHHYGTRYSVAVRETFWAAMRSGAATTEAAVIAGGQVGEVCVSQYQPNPPPCKHLPPPEIRGVS